MLEITIPTMNTLSKPNPAILLPIIAADANIAKSLSIRSVPLIYINGKIVPRWKLNNENLLAAMIMQDSGN